MTEVDRKPHVHVEQDAMLEAIVEVGGSAVLDDVAEHFDVSMATARRKLDGLVAQGKLRVYSGPTREYQIVDVEDPPDAGGGPGSDTRWQEGREPDDGDFGYRPGEDARPAA